MMPRELRSVFPNPDNVCQSEYRAMHNCIADGLEEVEPPERIVMARAMLEEFKEWAESLLDRMNC